MIISYQTDYDHVYRHALAMCQVHVPSVCVPRSVCKHCRATSVCDVLGRLHSFLRFVSERSRVSERCRQGLLTSLPVRRVGIAPYATFLSTPPRRRRKTEVDLTWSDPPVQVKPIDSVFGRKAFRGPEALGCGPALPSLHLPFFQSFPGTSRERSEAFAYRSRGNGRD